MAETERCGETLDGEMWPIGECALPAGHPGDHYAVVTWPRYERPEPSGCPRTNRWLTETWSGLLKHALQAQIVKPVVNPDDLTFHVEPHPTLPGVVVPVLDQAVRVDSATGAVEWGEGASDG